MVEGGFNLTWLDAKYPRYACPTDGGGHTTSEMRTQGDQTTPFGQGWRILYIAHAHAPRVSRSFVRPLAGKGPLKLGLVVTCVLSV